MARIAYLHGFASGPKPHSPKVAMLRELGHEVHCLSSKGQYRFFDYLRAIHDFRQTHDLPDLLAGTSLGGFWARYFGCRHDRPWIALNPAMHPTETLAAHFGTLQRFDTDACFDWSAEDVRPYENFEDQWLTTEVPGLIIVAKDDDVIDPHETWRFSGNCQFIELPRGGHALANTEDYVDTINRFMNRVLGP